MAVLLQQTWVRQVWHLTDPDPWTHPAHSPHKDATNLGVKINNFDMTTGHGKKSCSLHSIVLVG